MYYVCYVLQNACGYSVLLRIFRLHGHCVWNDCFPRVLRLYFYGRDFKAFSAGLYTVVVAADRTHDRHIPHFILSSHRVSYNIKIRAANLNTGILLRLMRFFFSILSITRVRAFGTALSTGNAIL